MVFIRIIDPQKLLMSLESLGFTYGNLQTFRKMIQSPNGIVLVTGPTGSGKNTTLYATLAELSSEDGVASSIWKVHEEENPKSFGVLSKLGQALLLY